MSTPTLFMTRDRDRTAKKSGSQRKTLTAAGAVTYSPRTRREQLINLCAREVLKEEKRRHLCSGWFSLPARARTTKYKSPGHTLYVFFCPRPRDDRVRSVVWLIGWFGYGHFVSFISSRSLRFGRVRGTVVRIKYWEVYFWLSETFLLQADLLTRWLYTSEV